MRQIIVSALKMMVWMTLITGVAYPLLVTGIAQLVFPKQANGSQIKVDGKVIGSEFVAQKFENPAYFWSRPSAVDYNPLPSGGSNYGWTSVALKQRIEQKRQHLAQGTGANDIPADLLLASASGLDPHITPAAAMWQVDRVAQARRFTANQRQQLEDMITFMTEPPSFRVLGEHRVHVLKLNLALDGSQP